MLRFENTAHDKYNIFDHDGYLGSMCPDGSIVFNGTRVIWLPQLREILKKLEELNASQDT